MNPNALRYDRPIGSYYLQDRLKYSPCRNVRDSVIVVSNISWVSFCFLSTNELPSRLQNTESNSSTSCFYACTNAAAYVSRYKFHASQAHHVHGLEYNTALFENRRFIAS